MLKTILVVADDTLIGSLIVHMIARNTPHLVILVNSSSEALTLTLDVKPDLFLFDSLLPIMNALDLYDCLQKRKVLQDVPTIFFSHLPGVQQYLRQEIEERDFVYVDDLFAGQEFFSLLEKVLS